MPDGWVGCTIKVAIPSCTTAGVAHVIAYTSEEHGCYFKIYCAIAELMDMTSNIMTG